MNGTTPPPGHPTRRATAVLACLPAFAVYPLAVVVGANAAVLPLSTAVIARDLAPVLAVTAILLWATRPLFPEFVSRGMWLGTFTLLFCCYGVILPLTSSLGVFLDPASWRVAAVYTLASLAIATLVVRPRRARQRHPLLLAVVAAAMMSLSVYAAVVGPNDGRWRPVADALTESNTGRPPRSPHLPPRDIYYIVLDGFGRSDVLRTYYALDLDRFVDFLRAKGFFVAERARSNYSQTYLSLASTLNFNGSTSDYVSGYRDPVLFVVRRLTGLVEALLGRPGPAPAIVVHGDHGPGSMLWWEDPQATNLQERMGILSACYMPDDGPPLYPAVSPVNGARALASRYFGVDLPFRPDKAVFSTWSRPYAFIEVTAEQIDPEAAP